MVALKKENIDIRRSVIYAKHLETRLKCYFVAFDKRKPGMRGRRYKERGDREREGEGETETDR